MKGSLPLQVLVASGLMLSLVSGQPVGGNERCKCLEEAPTLDPRDMNNLRGVPNITNYGVGCFPHDLNTSRCQSADFNCSVDPNVLSTETDGPTCANNWCSRSWCYVDPVECDLVQTFSKDYAPHSDLWYSYATCGELDAFTNATRLNALRGKTFRVGFNRNSGGWTGAYSTHNKQFEGPQSAWYGPAVEFVREAALRGGFKVTLTPPPEELWNKSVEYFSTSQFDYCVYATALGYLDFCVAKYTVTDERAVSAEWFVLDSTPLYLITMVEEEPTGIEVFKDKFLTIFRPFSGATWLLIMFGFLPFLAGVIMFQELGVKGSDFPSKEKKIIDDDNGLPPTEVEVKYPWWKNITRALYRSLLSYLRRFYGQPVQTYGGSWTVLAFCFIGMIGMSLYTAQMAAHLTADALRFRVESLDDAIRAGHTFCKCNVLTDLFCR